MAVRPMKWHIYNNSEEKLPLCWDDQALEFDSSDDACEFLISTNNLYLSQEAYDGYRQSIIMEDILYYDGGYLNATDLRCSTDPETAENILIKKDLL